MNMSHDEKNAVISIITNLVVSGFFGVRILQIYQSGAFAGEDALLVWARTVLWMIPASIVATMVFMIVGSILFAIAARDPKPDLKIDERDKQFRQRAMTAATVIASTGFILATVALAFGWSGLAAMNIILAGFVLADLGGSVTRLVSYRRGY